MQIAVCIFKYFPYGGIQRDLMKFARESLARGYRVRIYVLRWNAEPPPEAADGRLEIVVAPVRALSNHRLYARFARWVLAHVKAHPVDVVVGMNKMPGLDVYYAGDSCYEEKARTQRGVVYRLLPRYRHFAAFERAVFDPSVPTRILTISDRETPLFRKHYGTPASRFEPLPPGIDPDRRAPSDPAAARAEFRAAFELDEDTLLLLFVGSGFIKKGLDRALLAVQALPPALYSRTRLFVIGHDNAEPFRRMAKRLGIADRVRFFPGRADIPRFLFGADGLLLPAYDENAGMVIIEAMIAGVPALVTANCGYARYLQDANAGLVAEQPFDQDVFNAQLVELLTSEKREGWRRNGIRMADDPSIYQLAERAVDAFERAAAERRPVVAFTLFKYFPYGGLQRDFLQVARAVSARGYHVRVYTLSWEGAQPEGFEVVEVPVQAVANHVRYRRFARWVERDLAWRPAAAVVGFNKMPGLDVYFAADPCFEEKAREQRRAFYRFTARYRQFANFERAVFAPESSSRILLISPRQQVQFQKYYGTPAERFAVVPPGVSSDRRRPEDAEALRASLRGEFQIGEDELLVLLVGSGFITKGVDRALLAVAALPEALRSRVRFFVIGQDNPNPYLSMAEQLGIADRVTLFSGRDDIPRFLQGADLLLHPAYMESGGLVLLEAVIAGLPVIATDVCGFAPYVEQAGAGRLIASPFEQAALNAALAEALADAELRRCWSRSGVRFGHTADIFGMAERVACLIEERIRGTAVSA